MFNIVVLSILKMPKPLFNFSKDTLKMLREADKLTKSLVKCTNRKCRKIITKKKMITLGKKHSNDKYEKCKSTKQNVLTCYDKLVKEDKYGYKKMEKDLEECSKLECKKEHNNNNEFIENYDKKNMKIDMVKGKSKKSKK